MVANRTTGAVYRRQRGFTMACASARFAMARGMLSSTPKTLLVVAGLDPSGGAGFLADARIAAEWGHRAAGVVTVLTEQDTHGLRRAAPVDAELVGDQLRALLADVEVAAIKIGALGDEAIAHQVAKALELTSAPVIWDPVLRATAGVGALYAGAPQAALSALAPHLALITPNVGEAERLSGISITDLAAAEAAARAISRSGGVNVLVKGGHLEATDPVDVLVCGQRVTRIASERVPGGTAVHGTGCALSTAIASRLAVGDALEDAVRAAKQWLSERLRAPVAPGRGRASII
jgi:hydroxymethylpyrimidine/phosphomethylpyrimidine kinase